MELLDYVDCWFQVVVSRSRRTCVEVHHIPSAIPSVAQVVRYIAGWRHVIAGLQPPPNETGFRKMGLGGGGFHTLGVHSRIAGITVDAPGIRDRVCVP